MRVSELISARSAHAETWMERDGNGEARSLVIGRMSVSAYTTKATYIIYLPVLPRMRRGGRGAFVIPTRVGPRFVTETCNHGCGRA